MSNYFAGKAECVVAINDEAIASALDMVAAGSADETIDQLIRRAVRNVNDEIGDHWADLNEVILVEPELRAANALREQQRAADLALAIARRLGIEPDDVAAEALAAYAITAGRIVLERWLLTGRPDGRQGLNRLLERVLLILDPIALDALRHGSTRSTDHPHPHHEEF